MVGAAANVLKVPFLRGKCVNRFVSANNNEDNDHAQMIILLSVKC